MPSIFRKFCVILPLATILSVISCSEGDDAARIAKVNPAKITADDTHWQASVEVIFSQAPVNIQIDSKLVKPDTDLEVEPWSQDGEVVTLLYSVPRLPVPSGEFDNVPLPALLINCDITWSTGRQSIEVELNPPREMFFIKGTLEDARVAITDVLERWREGYETESIGTYMSAFWDQGFRYVSDLGSDDDKTDDLEFDDIQEERSNAAKFFEAFKDIEIQLSAPPEMSLSANYNRAEVRNHYEITVFAESNNSAWFGAGSISFVFEKRNNEWRIAEWHDNAYSPQEILDAKLLFDLGNKNPGSWAGLKSIL